MSQQLESVLMISAQILVEARKRLQRQISEAPQLDLLQGMENSSKVLCPFCLYQSEKGNRTSAVIRNGFFKCFACGKTGRVEQ